MKRWISAFCAALALLIATGAALTAVAEGAGEPIVLYGSYETLEKGSKGDDVKLLQQALIDQGFLTGKADGDFGKATAGAVASFQESVGLEATGIADEQTQQKLFGGVDVAAALLADPWCFNGGDDTTLNALRFSDAGTATLTQVTFDGNGRHEAGESECPYTLSAEGIAVELPDGTTLDIAFAAEGSQLILNDHAFWSLSQVDAALQGYWVSKYSDNVLGPTFKYEMHVYFGDGQMRSESANEGLNLSRGEYYYFGPYEGAYTIGIGEFDTDMWKGKNYFFNIIDNAPVVMNYTHLFEKTDKGFPGENGYKF